MKAASYFAAVPALIRFPAEAARQEAWGRLLEITPGGGKMLTLTELRRGEVVFVSFELWSREFKNFPATVGFVELDADGYWLAEWRWQDELARRQLAEVLVEVLSV